MSEVGRSRFTFSRARALIAFVVFWRYDTGRAAFDDAVVDRACFASDYAVEERTRFGPGPQWPGPSSFQFHGAFRVRASVPPDHVDRVPCKLLASRPRLIARGHGLGRSQS